VRGPPGAEVTCSCGYTNTIPAAPRRQPAAPAPAVPPREEPPVPPPKRKRAKAAAPPSGPPAKAPRDPPPAPDARGSAPSAPKEPDELEPEILEPKGEGNPRAVLVLVIAAILLVAAVATFLIISPASPLSGLFTGGDSPPSRADVQDRLNAFDAAGDGAAFTGSGTLHHNAIGTQQIELLFDPETDELYVAVAGLTSHYRGDEYTLSFQGTTQRFRSYGSNQETADLPQRFTVNERDPIRLQYRGGADDGEFTLVLDAAHRFQNLNVTWHGYELRMTFDYAGAEFPAFASAAPRGACDVVLPAARPQAGQRTTVELDGMSDVVRPDELELRFVDENQTLLRNAPFEFDVDTSGYYFHWEDVNGDGFVDAGDRYVFEFPEPADDVRIWDEWAAVHVDEFERAPSVPLGWLLGAIVAIVVARRR
jgi:hypothetical protein